MPESTAFDAGFLTSDNSGWRDADLFIDTDVCNGCSRCYMHCPDGAIFMESGKAHVDHRFCKGCGICKRMCARGAVSMGARA